MISLYFKNKLKKRHQNNNNDILENSYYETNHYEYSNDNNLFLNEFSLINQEFFNLINKKIISDRFYQINDLNNYDFKFYLRCLFLSISINYNIENSYLSDQINPQNLNKIVNKFLFNSEIFRKINLLNNFIEDTLNTKDVNLDINDINFEFNNVKNESPIKNEEKENINKEIITSETENKIKETLYENDYFLVFLNKEIFNNKLFSNKNDIYSENINLFLNNFDNQNQIKVFNDLLEINLTNLYSENNFSKINNILILIKSYEAFIKIFCFKIQKYFNIIKDNIFFQKSTEKECMNNLNNNHETQVFLENYLEYIMNLFYLTYSFILFKKINFCDKVYISEQLSNLSNCIDINLNQNSMKEIIKKLKELIRFSCNIKFNLEKKYDFWINFNTKINSIIPNDILNTFSIYEENNSNFNEITNDNLSELNFFNNYILNSVLEHIKQDFKNEINKLKFDNKKKLKNNNNSNNISTIKNFIFKFSEEFKNLSINKDFILKLSVDLEKIIFDYLQEFITNIYKNTEQDFNFNINSHNFEIFLNKDIYNSFKSLNYNKILVLIDKIANIFLEMKLKYFDLYLINSSKLILFENFNEKQNLSDKNIAISKTLINFVTYLKKNYTYLDHIILTDNIFETEYNLENNIFNLIEIYLRQNLKKFLLIKILNFYCYNIKKYKQIFLENNKNFKINLIILNDILLLKKIYEKCNIKLDKIKIESDSLDLLSKIIDNINVKNDELNISTLDIIISKHLEDQKIDSVIKFIFFIKIFI